MNNANPTPAYQATREMLRKGQEAESKNTAAHPPVPQAAKSLEALLAGNVSTQNRPPMSDCCSPVSERDDGGEGTFGETLGVGGGGGETLLDWGSDAPTPEMIGMREGVPWTPAGGSVLSPGGARGEGGGGGDEVEGRDRCVVFL